MNRICQVFLILMIAPCLLIGTSLKCAHAQEKYEDINEGVVAVTLEIADFDANTPIIEIEKPQFLSIEIAPYAKKIRYKLVKIEEDWYIPIKNKELIDYDDPLRKTRYIKHHHVEPGKYYLSIENTSTPGYATAILKASDTEFTAFDKIHERWECTKILDILNTESNHN